MDIYIYIYISISDCPLEWWTYMLLTCIIIYICIYIIIMRNNIEDYWYYLCCHYLKLNYQGLKLTVITINFCTLMYSMSPRFWEYLCPLGAIPHQTPAVRFCPVVLIKQSRKSPGSPILKNTMCVNHSQAKWGWPSSVQFFFSVFLLRVKNVLE